MILFYIPNSTQYLNLTTTLLLQMRSLLRQKSANALLIPQLLEIEPTPHFWMVVHSVGESYF